MANEINVTIPDIGTAAKVDIIEVMVKPGDKIAKDASLITLESDKASMEIPSPYAGTVKTVAVKVGSKVSQGDLILTLDSEAEGKVGEEKVAAPAAESVKTEPTKNLAEEKPQPAQPAAPAAKPSAPAEKTTDTSAIYAGPNVRRIAREFGVDLTQVTGSGRKGRIQQEDVQQYVKSRLAQPSSGIGINVAPAATIDFTQFGEIEVKPLNKIKRLTGVYVHRAWLTIPHVTQFDEADVTELENFRKQQQALAEKQGYKLTPLAFIVKAVVKALQHFPQFNASLDETGEKLIYKKYYNVGIAVDTPNGLVVPVLRNVDTKDIPEIAKEMAQVSSRAREKGLTPQDMSGSTFTISSLGGIGGTGFTPIVNAPDVAILGVSKTKTVPVYRNDQFEPRLMLPLSLSYDHRVIDGAEAARFSNYLCQCLADIRTLLL